jgi:hypothetical protein
MLDMQQGEHMEQLVLEQKKREQAHVASSNQLLPYKKPEEPARR